jgi:hypothetical protein
MEMDLQGTKEQAERPERRGGGCQRGRERFQLREDRPVGPGQQGVDPLGEHAVSAPAAAVGVAGPAALATGVVGCEADAGPADVSAIGVPRDQRLYRATSGALGR